MSSLVTEPAWDAALTAPRRRTPSQSGEDLSAELLAMIPQLRTFARMLSGSQDNAEDLAQETLAKAWQHRNSFRPGTNLRAWLFTIARHQFYSSRRRAWREAPFDQAAAEDMPSGASQLWSTELSDTLRALRLLPDSLRDALVLVGANGCSCEEAAVICGCPIGTVKSRVSRARSALLAMLGEARDAGASEH
jgi:RNA polymerase sigma-70 factor (ECF subfamily)